MEKRVFENPLIKDKVTLLKSSRETGGAYTLVEVELAPGGGNPLHYHTTFTEEFTAIEGVLGVQLEKEQLALQPGQQALVPINMRHRFYNAGKQHIRFEVRLTPGSESFENMIKIIYGLASDGLINKQGLPKNLDHLAVFVQQADIKATGLIAFLTPFLMLRAKRVNREGIYQQLLEKYA